MKTKAILVLVLLTIKLHFSVSAQQTSYWQQHVDYEINVVLDDVQHALNGSIALRYTNNSPDTLPEIWMHLWPNAYKNEQTAFARQKVEQGSTDFVFSKEEDKGYIDNLDFKVNGEAVVLTYDAENPDIAKLTLNKPLMPGQTINIKTTFHVQLPYCFSRLGHIGQQYQITQWYPKPAVYDQKGWHAFPYLDQGEFYSEFGNFHVFITVPKNYVVGGSGDLINQDEVAWLDSIAVATSTKDFSNPNMDFPASSATTKTLEYRLKDAHDFAWFADKRFNVMKSSVTLPESERIVTTYVYFPDKHGKEWIKACDYVNRSVAFYSDNVGEYPWNVAQAVDGTLEVEGAGGMEYPTITVIAGNHDAKMLDNVITHEVGHNWFYGILGSNEREHAWMDEGINSFYENRYMSTYYDRENPLGIPAVALSAFGGDTSAVDQSIWQINQVTQMQNKFQPVDMHAAEYTAINYGLVVYMETAYYLRYLEDVLGKDEFDRIMRKYYRDYQFKHPYPEDMQKLFEAETGESYAWFFDNLLKSDRGPDYSIRKLQKGKTAMAVTVENNSDIPASFSIALMDGDSVLRTDWFRGFTGSQTIYLNYNTSWNVTSVQIDQRKTMPETNRENNTIRTTGILKRVEPLQLKLFGLGADNAERTTVSIAPIVGWNNNDRWMPGIALWNSSLPEPMLEYVLAPMYSITRSEFTGQGSVGLNFYPDNGWFDRIRISESAARYTFDEYKINPLVDATIYTPQYLKLQTQVELDLHQKALRKKLSQQISLRSVYIQEENRLLEFDANGDVLSYESDDYLVNEAAYHLLHDKVFFPQKLDAVLTIGEDFTKASVTYSTLIHYPGMKKGIGVRVFGGTFFGELGADARQQFSLAGANGYFDPLYDDIYLGRNTDAGFVSNQMSKTNGFFKVPAFGFYPFAGSSIAAANLELAIPKVPLLEVFADFGMIGDGNDNVSGLQYDAGLMLSLPLDIFAVYFPLVMSEDLAGVFNEDEGYGQKVSFMLNLDAGNLFELMRKLSVK